MNKFYRIQSELEDGDGNIFYEYYGVVNSIEVGTDMAKKIIEWHNEDFYLVINEIQEDGTDIKWIKTIYKNMLTGEIIEKI